LYRSIEATDLQTWPYPHVVVDDFLSPDVLTEIDALWPEPDVFKEGGIDGNYLFDLTGRAPDDGWHPVLQDVVRVYLRNTLDVFAPYYAAKYGDLLYDASCWVQLQEMGDGFAGHEIHTHHFHSPNWLFTCLLYLDDAPECPGTSLYSVDGYKHRGDQLALAEAAALTLQWDDMPEILLEKSVGFQRNRYVAFLDTPISFHGVMPPEKAPAGQRTRRAIRIHVMGDRGLIETRYGMRAARYDVLRRRASRDPAVIAMLRQEIDEMLAVDPSQPAERPECNLVIL